MQRLVLPCLSAGFPLRFQNSQAATADALQILQQSKPRSKLCNLRLSDMENQRYSTEGHERASSSLDASDHPSSSSARLLPSASPPNWREQFDDAEKIEHQKHWTMRVPRKALWLHLCLLLSYTFLFLAAVYFTLNRGSGLRQDAQKEMFCKLPILSLIALGSNSTTNACWQL